LKFVEIVHGITSAPLTYWVMEESGSRLGASEHSKMRISAVTLAREQS